MSIYPSRHSSLVAGEPEVLIQPMLMFPVSVSTPDAASPSLLDGKGSRMGIQILSETPPSKNSNLVAPAHSFKEVSAKPEAQIFRTKSGIRERTSVVPLIINLTKEIVSTPMGMVEPVSPRGPPIMLDRIK